MKGLSRYSRILHYLQDIDSKTKLPPQEKKLVEELHEKLKKIGIKIKTIESVRIIFFLLLYSSIISGLTSFLPELAIFTKEILKFSGVIGSTLSFLILGITTFLMGIYSTDLYMISNHIISIYTKYQK